MGVVIGIDVGGSTTKIVGFRKVGEKRELISPLFVKAADPVTSIYGAFGKFTDQNGLTLSDIEQVLTTGVGSSYLSKPIYELPCSSVPEFKSIGLGGLYLSHLDEAIVVSMGTGTAIVHARKGQDADYLGGTGVGGGTMMGLSKKILGIEEIEHLEELAAQGDLSHVDLRVGDITKKDKNVTLPDHMTASNFGKLSDVASPADVALGIMNTVFETIGMLALFAARSRGVGDIVLTGNLSRITYAKDVFASLSSMFSVNFMIPENAQYATVIGTALCG
ncbi:MAG: type II pantothenate kinase [Clostridia bacterium]|nr:type II pantothenate kinase [Clostridia bacterium]